MASNNLRFNRILRKYDFLIKELEDVNEMQSVATREFMRGIATEKGKDTGQDPEPIIIEDEEETPEKIQMEAKYKKLFRKIVIETHPDNQIDGLTDSEKFRLVEIYDSTIEAYDKGDEATLISNAVKLDLDVSEFEDEFEEIEEACKELETTIQQIQGTSAWYYMYILKTDAERKDFIKRFLKLTNDLDESKLNE